MLLLLLLIWIVFNGNFTLEIFLVGLAVSGLIYLFMWKFLSWSIRKDLMIFRFVWFGISYSITLIIEIIKASFATIAISFNSRVDVSPVLVKFDTDIENTFLKVILANSITLTPGTITVSLMDNHYTVHALDETFAIDIDESVFVEKLRKADALIKAFKEKN